MSGQASTPSQFAQLTQGYEAVRRRWRGESEDTGARLGLDLLLRRGTSAWLQSRYEVSEVPAIKPGNAVCACEGSGPLPTRHAETAALLLLAMALTATRDEARA